MTDRSETTRPTVEEGKHEHHEEDEPEVRADVHEPEQHGDEQHEDEHKDEVHPASLTCRHIIERDDPVLGSVEYKRCVGDDDGHTHHWGGGWHWDTGERGAQRVPGAAGGTAIQKPDDDIDVVYTWRDALAVR